MGYKVARASEYLAITGGGIQDIKLAKKSWVFPWQSCTVFDVSPVNYTFEVQAMSSEKLPFVIPAVFTIVGNSCGEGSTSWFRTSVKYICHLFADYVECFTRVTFANIPKMILPSFGISSLRFWKPTAPTTCIGFIPRQGNLNVASSNRITPKVRKSSHKLLFCSP
ncbi:unnamed protein product [Brassica oleracea]